LPFSFRQFKHSLLQHI